MKKNLLVIVICFELFIVIGCGAKEIQSQTYVTCLGIDFTNGEFIVYTQALNFSNIAKQEGTTSLQDVASIFVGESKAKTIQAALNNLEQKAALPFYYGHVNAILLSENVIKDKMESVIEFIAQNPFLRYNLWLFGTQQDVREILLGESFFNFPSIYTILHNPKALTKNSFYIPIEEYNKFISTYYQPIGTYIIPSLSLDDTNFSEDDKKINISVVTGGFSFSQQKYKGWVDKEELVGLKWLDKNSTNIPLSLFEEKVSMIIQNPKTKVEVINGPKPTYRLIVKIHSLLVQNEGNISNKKIKIELEDRIKNEILKTLEKSEAIKTDLLNISESAYRHHLTQWDKSTINSFSKGSIEDIEVRIHIVESINYKR
ncbi:Ger(x)C family spore germination protein [Robertmurraya kyonggiensis]|uniref:Ger(X)C family spore germination protein n=1 Tax=Robertmurraya kyonggiensis TaxID=1037680 RepID=A0A4U1DBG3_9BACI|nr:Ger(x)C family spore germination protein [Robertmurraya kyonggiensis]TKC19393.1 Ger(x)C family spore germination protein [Robertmurraya kyonggiensis]